MELSIVSIEKPEAVNFILGQSHFIKTVEDLHEALVSAVPGIRFGLAFCEASGKCLIRWSGTDEAMIELEKKNAMAIGAGHSFILFLAEGYFPVNVLNAVKRGASIIILSDRNADFENLPIPNLLALRAVVNTHNDEGVRLEASIVVHTGEVRSTHHVATLIGFGATAVGAEFHIVPIFRPCFAPRHWAVAILANFFRKRGFRVSLFFHRH